ncbi:hypothetical protein AYK24_06290 [Thermoplasmatales archaeon SG8-52-4]|nr:MAG: hypothetical protein AYK24_06290 [Thermoplasmatales archaeon SG8-52-4]
MKNIKALAGILLFGSLWGFSEVIIGSAIQDIGLPSGIIMTGVFAIAFLVVSRIIYRQPGMQFGMGLVAGGLRLFNPFIGCHLCSAIAIMAEGAIFELIWYKISFDFSELKSNIMKSSMGIISAYFLYIGGYIVTQILTPIAAGANFYIENLIVFMPRILSSGLFAAIIGGAILPIVFLAKDIKITLKDRIYYPTTIGITILCWFIVVGNWFFT